MMITLFGKSSELSEVHLAVFVSISGLIHDHPEVSTGTNKSNNFLQFQIFSSPRSITPAQKFRPLIYAIWNSQYEKLQEIKSQY